MGINTPFNLHTHTLTCENLPMKLLVKHRYSYINGDTGQRVETLYHITAEAAAASKMLKGALIPETREEHYIEEVTDAHRFAAGFVSGAHR